MNTIFLDKNQVKQILSIFNSGKFVDGARTGNKSKFVKRQYTTSGR